VPYAHYGETVRGVLEALGEIGQKLAFGLDRQALQHAMQYAERHLGGDDLLDERGMRLLERLHHLLHFLSAEQVGDYIVVTKWSYGYSRFSVAPFQGLVPVSGRLFSSEPKRGDIVVFRPERQQDRDLIKRLIGMPGDRIQVRDGAVFINDEPIARESLGARPFKQADGSVIDIQAYKETLPNGVNYITFDRESAGVFDTTPVFVVPEGRYFFMGDDRDNSDDSRGSVGYVPIDHLVGKAQFVFISFDHIVPRADRLLKGLN
jgi:signal peptidase I